MCGKCATSAITNNAFVKQHRIWGYRGVMVALTSRLGQIKEVSF